MKIRKHPRTTAPEELLGAPLVGGEADHLPDQVPHKLVVLGELALAAGRLGLQRVLGGLVALLQTDTDLIAGGHCFCNGGDWECYHYMKTIIKNRYHARIALQNLRRDPQSFKKRLQPQVDKLDDKKIGNG